MNAEDIAALKDGHAELQRNVAELRVELDANTAATKETKSAVGELLEWLEALKGVLKVLNLVGSVAKPLGYIAAAVSAAGSAWYVFIHKGPN